MSSFLLVSGCVLAWMVSPEALVVLGNSVGAAGTAFFFSLAGGLLLSSLAATVLHNPPLKDHPGPPAFSDLFEAVGLVPAMAVLLASRFCLVLFLPTGMLVTAGFAFNETFWYRFPNFAFSALLLVFIFTLHLIGQRIAVIVQVLFVGTTVACLLLLVLAGLPALFSGLPGLSLPGATSLWSMEGLFTALLLFLGYDQARPRGVPGRGAKDVVVALVVCGVVYTLWAAVLLSHIPRETLSSSTLPHVLAAREILGQPGRMIMAAAVISGACGVVNGLFILTNNTLRNIAVACIRRSPAASHERVYSFLYASGIGLALAAGLAGSNNLETYMHGSLLLWLLAVAVLSYAAAKRLHALKQPLHYLGYPLCALYLAAILWLASTAGQPGLLAMFCLIALSIAAIISSVWLRATGRCLGSINVTDQGEAL